MQASQAERADMWKKLSSRKGKAQPAGPSQNLRESYPFRQAFLQKRWAHLTVFLFSFLIYANTIPNDYNLDDELVTSISPAMQHPLVSKGIRAIPDIFTKPYYSDEQGYAYEYRPVVLTTFALEHSLLGNNPHVSHAVNALLYALLCVLLLSTLSLLLNNYHPLVAILTCLLFAAHPIHTEVVASIKNRDEILALMGGTGALLFFLHYAEKKKVLFILAAMLCFAAGMLSKQSIISFVVIIPALLVMFTRLSWKEIFLVSFILGTITFPLIQLITSHRLKIIGGAIGLVVLIHQIRNPAVISSLRKALRGYRDKISNEMKEGGATGYFRLGNNTFVTLFIFLLILTAVFPVLKAFYPGFRTISSFLPLIPVLGIYPLCAFAPERIKKYFIWVCLGGAVCTIMLSNTLLAKTLLSGRADDLYTLFALFFAHNLILY
ncbi:MAG TPA: glycosyltransferase family 39 protein, partial [Chitinophagales bacterium]|nr:glycosyltransferase family 39 protein [Chitinophagales bacterium]